MKWIFRILEWQSILVLKHSAIKIPTQIQPVHEIFKWISTYYHNFRDVQPPKQRDFLYVALFYIFVQHICSPLKSNLYWAFYFWLRHYRLLPPSGSKQEKLNFVTNKEFEIYRIKNAPSISIKMNNGFWRFYR